MLPRPYPVLPDGQKWPEGRWAIDERGRAWLAHWCRKRAGTTVVLAVFMDLEHLPGGEHFYVAVVHSDPHVGRAGWAALALAPRCSGAAALLEGVRDILRWGGDPIMDRDRWHNVQTPWQEMQEVQR